MRVLINVIDNIFLKNFDAFLNLKYTDFMYFNKEIWKYNKVSR